MRRVIAVFVVALVSCALSAVTSLAQSARDEGSHILVMVMAVATREDTLATGADGALGMLRANGISDDEIRDGSVAVGMVYCCGGKVSFDTRTMFYVPANLSVAEGDVVEVSIGREASRRRKDSGSINRAVAVRESLKAGGGACRWDPEEEGLWMRVLYCDWMPAEGWQFQRGLSKTWFRPASATE